MLPIAELVALAMLNFYASLGGVHDQPVTLSVEESLTEAEVWHIAYDVSGSVTWADEAVPVIRCESRFRPRAVGARRERGLAQLHPVHRPWIRSLGYTWDEMFEPSANLAVAYALWQERGWVPTWSCAQPTP